MSDDIDAYSPLYDVENGAHSFQAGPGCPRVRIHLPLTGEQVQFLSSNPAAVRACLAKGTFTQGWLKKLMTSVAIINASGDPRTVH